MQLLLLHPAAPVLAFSSSSCSSLSTSPPPAIAQHLEQPQELLQPQQLHQLWPPPLPSFCERGVHFSVGPSFFRHQSSLGRDLAVLAAALYKRKHGQLRVLDAMSGCGVRALRYLVQSQADYVLANDSNQSLHQTIVDNFSRYAPPDCQSFDCLPSAVHTNVPECDFFASSDCLPSSTHFASTSKEAGREVLSPSEASDDHHDNIFPISGLHLSSIGSPLGENGTTGSSQRKWEVIHEEANRLLLSCYLNRDFFDLIDVDSFGSDSLFIGAALSAVRRGGLLYLTCTDGFSSGGHRPHNALASYGAFVKPMPYANELGLRMLIGGVVKEAALRKMNIRPVFSVYSSHGPVFRVLLRVSPGKLSRNKHYGFIYYCTKCGDSNVVDWEGLGATACPCSQQVSNSLKMSGPLWTGPLHTGKDIQEMIALAREWGWISNVTDEDNGRGTKTKPEKLSELLDLMFEESHPDLKFGFIHLDEIAKRGKIPTPRRDVLIHLLQIVSLDADGITNINKELQCVPSLDDLIFQHCMKIQMKVHIYRHHPFWM